MIINKGQLITFSEGVYSDYCVNGLVVAKMDFDIELVKSEWQESNTKEGARCKFMHRSMRKVSGMDFLPWLVKRGLVEDVDYMEINTGYHGVSDVTY